MISVGRHAVADEAPRRARTPGFPRSGSPAARTSVPGLNHADVGVLQSQPQHYLVEVRAFFGVSAMTEALGCCTRGTKTSRHARRHWARRCPIEWISRPAPTSSVWADINQGYRIADLIHL